MLATQTPGQALLTAQMAGHSHSSIDGTLIETDQVHTPGSTSGVTSTGRAIAVAFKKPKGGQLTEEQKDHNRIHNGKRAVDERGSFLLTNTLKALHNISVCPRLIGTIVADALVPASNTTAQI